ncbi:conserved hypothetical protein [Verticillium alfalfae VaMs.102]|uniref:RRM domain-containing protein n=1 Tax=Verticillium alfalfae (strain VaMs.102 / ATCC MYA-4576 / FGSC 10136) TaxID=526221 RepID=C9S6Q0_VERA1|nr:conserved hypothetical protein [Verticillium alfalfae VaMs.102]EEY14541.1 conserved hypothetical protein [Verticillium alfalfae VaMs.102]
MTTEKTNKTPMSEDASSPKKRKAELEELEVDLEAPEPPSKRAKRAQKKGKTLPPKQDSDDEKEAKKEEKEKLKSNRSEHGVWVGNMPFAVTPDMLRKWLIENSGEVITNESITRINMPMTKDGGNKVKKNKGFAYVDFADIGAKVAAIALTENELLYRKLLIKDSTSYDGRPKKDEAEIAAAAKKKAEDEIPTSRKIFVGNLSFQTTEEDVRANFEKCGEIDWVKVATFEDSGKCKGYGWVKFREAESAGWAVKGFCRIKEELETEDDFVKGKKDKDADAEDNSDEEEDTDAQSEKKFKMRKWWVNRIAGRNLKIELAEDDQVRYKKRFGKDAPRRQVQADGTTAEGGEVPKREKKPVPPRELKAQDDLMVARLTGTAAKHTGTKITFD